MKTTKTITLIITIIISSIFLQSCAMYNKSIKDLTCIPVNTPAGQPGVGVAQTICVDASKRVATIVNCSCLKR